MLIADNLSSASILPVSTNVYTPRDLFGSPAMESLLATLRERFDVVVLDTAPVLLVAETRTIAALADTTVLVVRWRKTSKHAVAATLKLLRNARITLSGAALSQVDLTQPAAASGADPTAYYKSYQKYYSE